MSVSTVRPDVAQLADTCISIRRTILDEASVAGSGHYGPSMSCVEILVSLYFDFLNIDPSQPQWGERDRFVLSKGHACSALYAVLATLGYFPIEELRTFTRLGSKFGDHPDMRKVVGVDFSAGALGHGLSVGLGMALAAKLNGSDSRTVVLLGDGELNEGQIWEAAGFAGAKNVSNLLAIVDGNKVCVDGTVEDVMDFEPLDDKWRAFRWNVERIDGHSLTELRGAYERFDERRRTDGGPTVIIADTVSGKGIEFIEGLAEWHIGYLGGVDVDRALDSITATQVRK